MPGGQLPTDATTARQNHHGVLPIVTLYLCLPVCLSVSLSFFLSFISHGVQSGKSLRIGSRFLFGAQESFHVLFSMKEEAKIRGAKKILIFVEGRMLL